MNLDTARQSRAPQLVLVGLGFTTRRLQRRLLDRGESVYGLKEFEAAGVPRKAVAVHTIPPLSGDERERLHDFLRAIEPRRVIYISATSVYGDEEHVDETTVACPSEAKGWARLEEEQWLQSNRWSNLIVRSAAIYGPGRGVHEKVREGRLPRSAGSGVVSRIHVDDLVSVLEAGIHSDLEGAFPLGDDHPCPSAEVADFCVRLGLREETGQSGWEPSAGHGPAPLEIHGRRVDGRKIRELLGVRLKYPSYETGIPASLAERE